jgi:hypothetical protein
VVLQAFVDNSYDQHIHVLAGYIATVDDWKVFSDEWQAELDASRIESFKMSQMAREQDGMIKAALFYCIIERHVKASIAVIVDIDALKMVVRSLSAPLNVFEIDKLENPYYLANRKIITMLTQFQEKMGLLEPVDFIFDDQTEKRDLMDGWELFKAGAPSTVRRFLGATPRFEDDKQFLPLQAADLFAWWIRRWESNGQYDDPMKPPPFPWGEPKGIAHLHIRYDEHEIRGEVESIFSDPRSLARSVFLARQSKDVLRQIDEARAYEEESSQARDRTSLRSRLLRFLGRFR